MPSPLVNATLQAAFLSGLSNILAQGLKSYRSVGSISVNLTPLFQFVFFTLISCPPNFLWQEWLENQYPGFTLQADGTKSFSKLNTARKLTLDQTLGAFINTSLFLAAMSAFKGKDSRGIQRDVQRELWPIMVNGWKLWPAVALLNFTLVPVHRRILVGSLVGLFWGIYLSLVASRSEDLILKPLQSANLKKPCKAVDSLAVGHEIDSNPKISFAQGCKTTNGQTR